MTNKWPKIGQLYKITNIFTSFYKKMPTIEEFLAGNNNVLPKLNIGDFVLILDHIIIERSEENSYNKTEIFYFLYNNRILWTHLIYSKYLEEIIE